jgi:hypothetical protein
VSVSTLRAPCAGRDRGYRPRRAELEINFDAIAPHWNRTWRSRGFRKAASKPAEKAPQLQWLVRRGTLDAQEN